MCWNWQTSLATFLIGTACNVVLYGLIKKYPKNETLDRSFIAMILIWEYILLMQLFDFFSWISQGKEMNCTPLNRMATIGAYIETLTQPIVVICILLLLVGNQEKWKYTFAGIALFIYIIGIFYELYFKKHEQINCMRPTETCSHLDYVWWGNMKISQWLYLIIIFGSILLLLQPSSFAMLQAGYLFIAYMISYIWYSCSIANMWCWVSAFAPIVNILIWKFYV